jgi:hypothetical protein
METQKRNKTIYWTLTTLLMLPAAGGGVVELFTNGPENVAQTLVMLGYPLYIMKILGLAKVLGGVAILTGRVPRLKEWAYAGFAFDFLGAIASHLLAGDAPQSILAPLAFFGVLMTSYTLWYKTSATPVPS